MTSFALFGFVFQPFYHFLCIQTWEYLENNVFCLIIFMRTETPSIIESHELLYLSANLLLLTYSTWDDLQNLSLKLWATPGHLCLAVVMSYYKYILQWFFNNLKSDIFTVGFLIITFQGRTTFGRSVQREFRAVFSHWGHTLREAQSESYNPPKIIFTSDKT